MILWSSFFFSFAPLVILILLKDRTARTAVPAPPPFCLVNSLGSSWRKSQWRERFNIEAMFKNRKIKTTMRKKKLTPKPLVAITIKENSQDHYGRKLMVILVLDRDSTSMPWWNPKSWLETPPFLHVETVLILVLIKSLYSF